MRLWARSFSLSLETRMPARGAGLTRMSARARPEAASCCARTAPMEWPRMTGFGGSLSRSAANSARYSARPTPTSFWSAPALSLPCPIRSGVCTVQPSLSNTPRNLSKHQPPADAPCSITMSLLMPSCPSCDCALVPTLAALDSTARAAAPCRKSRRGSIRSMLMRRSGPWTRA